MDLFVVNGLSADALYLNAGNGTFVRKALFYRYESDEPSRAAAWADWNGAGPCVRAAALMRAFERRDHTPHLLRRVRAGDGRLDVYIVPTNFMYTQRADGFFDRESIGNEGCALCTYSVHDYWWRTNKPVVTAVAWADMDNDGDPDLVLGHGGCVLIYVNQGGPALSFTKGFERCEFDEECGDMPTALNGISQHSLSAFEIG